MNLKKNFDQGYRLLSDIQRNHVESTHFAGIFDPKAQNALINPNCEFSSNKSGPATFLHTWSPTFMPKAWRLCSLIVQIQEKIFKVWDTLKS